MYRATAGWPGFRLLAASTTVVVAVVAAPSFLVSTTAKSWRGTAVVAGAAAPISLRVIFVSSLYVISEAVDESGLLRLPNRRFSDATERRFSDSRSGGSRSEEHTSELQSHSDLVCRLLLEK